MCELMRRSGEVETFLDLWGRLRCVKCAPRLCLRAIRNMEQSGACPGAGHRLQQETSFPMLVKKSGQECLGCV